MEPRGGVHSWGLGALGLGYLNLPMARSGGDPGDSGKCSPPTGLASAVPRARDPEVGGAPDSPLL